VTDPVAVRQGTLDMLILQAVSHEPMHGWNIGDYIKKRSADALDVPQGSLYPALHRLEGRGALVAEWKTTDDNRRAKYYRLTGAGKKILAAELADWQRFMQAVQLVMKPA
jgi:PadR family transcriptional regulator, regulatory protein PadR